MELDFRAFTFVVSLAAVINGLGLVRVLTGLAEGLKQRSRSTAGDGISGYWVYNSWFAFQLVLHVLLWWQLWGIQAATAIGFLQYVSFLLCPTLLFLAAALIVPSADDDSSDLHEHYYHIRVYYFTVNACFWFWVLLQMPILLGKLAPAAPFWVGFLLLALVLRFTSNEKVHAALALVPWVLLMIFIPLFAINPELAAG